VIIVRSYSKWKCSNSKTNSLKDFALNVCGLISKLRAPELEEICENYDILCFSESKFDEFDNVHIQHFVQHPPVIRSGAKCKSGGVVVFFKSPIFVNTEVLKSSSENVLWFILKDVLYAPVLFGAMYIPPENSIYSSIDFIDVIEDDILKFVAEKNCNVCLLCVFNVRSGTKDDFVNLDDYVCNTVQLDDVLKQEFDLVNLDILGINCKRVSLVKFVNNYGNRLLVLCQNLNLLIANGRLGKDKMLVP
jgi:hypothetical protein